MWHVHLGVPYTFNKVFHYLYIYFFFSLLISVFWLMGLLYIYIYIFFFFPTNIRFLAHGPSLFVRMLKHIHGFGKHHLFMIESYMVWSKQIVLVLQVTSISL
jgi:hypothetical protein